MFIITFARNKKSVHLSSSVSNFNPCQSITQLVSQPSQSAFFVRTHRVSKDVAGSCLTKINVPRLALHIGCFETPNFRLCGTLVALLDKNSAYFRCWKRALCINHPWSGNFK